MNEFQRNHLKAFTGQASYTRPQDGVYDYHAEEEAKMAWAIDQATARGLIDPDDAEAAKTNNDRTWFDKMMGFEQSSRNMFGPVGQAAIDVLSVGNYATAALSKATIKDPLVQIGGLKIGATPSAWFKEWKQRPYYTDMVDNFAAGLAMDIAVDPLTWLSFGVGAGTKVGATGIAKVGVKALPQGTKSLTLTRYGEKIYRFAAKDLAPEIEKLVGKQTEELIKQGRSVGYMEDAFTKLGIHEMIGRHMIDNHEKLALMMQRQEGAVSKLINRPARKGVDAVLAGEKFGTEMAEDMFKETARWQHLDRGVSLKGTGKALASLPVIGDGFRAIAPNFHRSFNVPQDVMDVWHKTKNTISQEAGKEQKRIKDAFAAFGLDDDEMRLASAVAEAGDSALAEGSKHLNGRIIDDLAKPGSEYIPDHVKKAAMYAREEFDRILKAEQAAGFKIDSLKDYVYRVFSTDAARTLHLRKLKDHLGISDFSQPKGFQMHRSIATIDDAIDAFGKGMVETNLATLVMKRNAASIRMREMEKFYDYLKATSGYTGLLAYKATNEAGQTAALLKDILKSQLPKESRIYDFHQLYGHADSIHQRLGFLTGKAYEGTGGKRSLDLLDYLSMPVEKRFDEASSALVKRLKPNGVAQGAEELKRTGKVFGKPVDVVDEIRSIYEGGQDILEKAAAMSGVKFEKLTFAKTQEMIVHMDGWARKELGAPLLHIFPDFLNHFELAIRKHSHGRFLKNSGKGLVYRVGTERGFKKLRQQLERDLGMSVRGKVTTDARKLYNPKLPKELIQRAQFTRMRYGDISDVIKPEVSVIKRIADYRKMLKMSPENLNEVIKALHAKDSIGSLTAREAEQLAEFLGIHTGKYTALHGKKSLLAGEYVRAVEFGGTTNPAFKKIGEAVEAGLKKLEDWSLDAVKARSVINDFERKIQNAKGKIADVERRIAEIQQMLPGTAAEAIESGVKSSVKLADELDTLTKQRAAIQSEIDSLSTKLAQRQNAHAKSIRPEVPTDDRTFRSAEEFLSKNADSLSEREVKELSKKQGVQKVYRGIRSFIPKAESEALSAARKELRKKAREIEKRSRELADKMGKSSSADAERIYQEGLTALQKEQDELLKKLSGDFESKVKLVGDGKYLAPDGKVREILVREGNKGGVIAGKWSDEIRKALLHRALKEGNEKFHYLKPAMRSEIPDYIVGQSAGRYYLPKSIADFVDQLNTPKYAGTNEMVDGFLRMFDRIQTLYKVPLLAPWMSTMARNAIGNVSLVYLKAGLSLAHPQYLADFAKATTYMLARESPAFRKIFVRGNESRIKKLGEVMIKTDIGTEVPISEVVEGLAHRGVMTAWMRDEVFDTGIKGYERAFGAGAGAAIGGSVAGPIGAGGGAAIGAMLGRESYKMEKLFKFQELASEIPTRMMLGIHEFKRTGSFDEAGRAVRDFLHDYSELSTFETRVIRRAMPFYNFTKLVIKSSAKGIIDNPGRFLQPYKLFRAQNTAPIWNEKAMPEDVPDWYHKQFVFMGRDIDPDTGEIKSWVQSGYNLPSQEAINLLDEVGPGGAPITRLGARGPFGFKSALEYALNYDSFTGSAIYPDVEKGIGQTRFQSGKSFKASPDWMKTLVGYRVNDDGKETVDPKIAWALGQVPTSRFISTSKKIYEMDGEEAKKLNTHTIARTLLGVSTYRYDPATQKYYEDRKRINAMANILANIQVLKTYENNSVRFKRTK